MRIREKPPVVVDPSVEHLMKGDMIEIRNTILDLIPTVAGCHGIQIDRIRIMLHVFAEDDWENVIFEIYVAADEDSAFAYWEAVSDAVSQAEEGMEKAMQDTLNYHVGVSVEW